MHHVTLAPQIALEDTPAQFLVHQVQQLDRARVHGNGPRFPSGTGIALNATIGNAASRELHGEHASDGAAAYNQNRCFARPRHWSMSKAESSVRIGGRISLPGSNGDKNVVGDLKTIAIALLSVGLSKVGEGESPRLGQGGVAAPINK